MDKPAVIWAIVLAAGESRRMGTQKLLLPIEGATVVECVVNKAWQSGVSGVLAVLGADRSKVRRALRPLSVSFVVNKEFRRGMLSSIQAAFRVLPEDLQAAVVMLGDQPAIPASIIRDLIQEYQANPKGIVVPVHGGRRGHPILIDGKFRPEILQLDPLVGLRQLLWSHPEAVREVAVDSPAILKDLDHPEDYAAEIRARSG